MKTISVWITLGLVVLALALGVGGGWVVKGWKDGADLTVEAKADTKAAKDEADKAKQTYDYMLSQVTANAAKVRAQNDQNTVAMTTLTTALGAQTNAIAKLKNQYASLVVGSCTYNADGDELLQQSYEAAMRGTSAVNPAR